MGPRGAEFLDAVWYLHRFPEVARAGVTPVRAARQHFRRFGRFEGRMPCAVQAWAEEAALWAGQTDTAGLAALCDSPAAAERAWACYALARWRVAQGDTPQADWVAADALLGRPAVAQDLLYGFGMLPPVVFMIEAALRAGKPARARSLLTRARAVFGVRPALRLMAANLCLWPQNGSISPQQAQAWSAALRPIYAGAGLDVPRLQTGAMPADLSLFDCVSAPARQGFRLALPGWRPAPSAKRGSSAKVSVLVPMRNAALTLDTALRSLCAQSWQDLEILVIDNGSTDASAAIAQAWAARDSRIRLLDASAEPGAYAARNIGLAAAQGAFITVLDADDWAHPAKIAAQVRALLARPDHPACVSHWARATPELGFTNWRADVGLVHRNVSSLMICRSVQDRLGFWDRVRVGADTEYYLRLRAVWGSEAVLEVLPDLPLSFGRQGGAGLTQRKEIGLTSQFNGLRHEYLMASAGWHDTLRRGGDPYLAQYPGQRPFGVNPVLALAPVGRA